jgi:Tfp pilus assembly protein PilO
MRNNPRFWLIGGLIFVLMVGLAGWMVVVNPVFGTVSETNEEIDATDRTTDTVMAQTRQLAQQKEDLERQIEMLMRIRDKIPKDVNVPRLMRTIQAEARAENVELDSLQPGQITLFKVTPEPSTSSAAPESTASDEPTKAAPEPTPSNLGQGVAPKNTGVAYVPLTLSGQGSYESIQNLIARLEQQQRAFLITVLDINRQTDSDAKAPLEFTMQARVFVLNGDAVQLPADLQPTGGE